MWVNEEIKIQELVNGTQLNETLKLVSRFSKAIPDLLWRELVFRGNKYCQFWQNLRKQFLAVKLNSREVFKFRISTKNVLSMKSFKFLKSY